MQTVSIVGEAIDLKRGFKSFQVTWSPKNNWKFKSSKMQYIVVMNQLIVWLMWTINTYQKKFENPTFSVGLSHKVFEAPNLKFFYPLHFKKKIDNLSPSCLGWVVWSSWVYDMDVVHVMIIFNGIIK